MLRKENKIIKSKKCLVCGKVFNYKPEYPDRRMYCSNNCRWNAKKRESCICKHCGKEYIPKAKGRTTYCSRECSYGYHTALRLQREEELKSVKKILVCAICGKEFVDNNIQKKYCSKKCEKKRSLQRYIKRYESVVKKCRYCDQEFYPSFGGEKYYCSSECRLKIKRDLKKIDKQRRKAIIKKVKRTLTAKQWVIAQQYFNNRCAYCGKKRNKPIHQDHVIPLSKGGEYTKHNIIPACYKCNSRKANKDMYQWYTEYKHYNPQRMEAIEMYLACI